MLRDGYDWGRCAKGAGDEHTSFFGEKKAFRRIRRALELTCNGRLSDPTKGVFSLAAARRSERVFSFEEAMVLIKVDRTYA